MKRFASIFLGSFLLLCSCSENNSNNNNNLNNNDNVGICQNGFSGVYACNDYDLMAHMSLTDLQGSGSGNDCWGWTDSNSNREFALVGTSSGVSFVEITNPTEPVLIGTLPTATVNSSWRDVKVYSNHAFVVSEAANHGMQVFDLSRLLSVSNPPETFTSDAHYTQFGSAHNIVINESSGFAYAVGTTTFGGGPHFVNIQDPVNPTAASGYSADSYSHDAQVVTYSGPDSDYTGKEILIGSNENEIAIVDVSDKNNPVSIATIGYSNIGYAHQGWFTEDQTYFILGDELDEVNFGSKTRTLVFDFTDLDNPSFHMEYLGSTNAIDHNLYVKGNTLYQANYTSGVRIIDISNIANKVFTEIGFFDTYPNSDGTVFNGAWNVYPYFQSGNIIISDIDRGLFIIRKSGS